MKILIDARMYGLEHSGIGRYLIHLVENLEKLGDKHEFVVFLRQKYFDELKLPKNWKKVKADIKHYSLKEQIILPRLISKEKPDLVHFPHFNIPIILKEKFVVTIHDMTMHKQGINATNLPLPLYLLKRFPYKIIFNYAVQRSMEIITPSKNVKKEIVDYFNLDQQKVVVTYEGIDDRFISNNSDVSEMDVLAKYGLVDKKFFFYVGNAYPHKNLEIVVKAVADINKNKNSECYFVIAGSRDVFVQKLERHIKLNEADEYVKILGFIPEKELKILYKNSVGFVYPSLAEGFGLQGLEAIASGTILLASNIDVFKEIYNSHAFYFNPKDVLSVSSTMFSVLGLSSRDKYKYLSSAQEFIKKYSWEEMTKETLKVYMSTQVKV